MSRPRWTLLAAVVAVQAVGIGATFGAFTVFVDPVAQDFGASRAQVSFGIGLLALMIGVTGPFWGRWIDTGSFRRIMLLGSVGIAASLFAASFAPSIGMLGLACLVVGGMVPLVGPLTAAALVGKLFVEGRGRAMGIAAMGPPAGAALFAVIAGEVIPRADWRLALRVFSLLALCLTPIIWLAIPRKVASPRRPETPAESGGGSLLRSRDFVAAALAMGMTVGLSMGWGAHVAPFVMDLGHDLEAAARVAAVAGGMGIVGTLGFGIVADRISPRWLFVTTILLQVGGFAIYLSEPAYSGLIATAALFGICGGSFTTLYALILAERFGADGLGRSLGLTNLFILPFGVLSAPLAGTLRDTTGSYAAAIVVLMTGLVIAASSLLLVRPAGRP